MVRDTPIDLDDPGHNPAQNGRQPLKQNAPVSKEDFCRFCRLLYERDLVTGVGGNASVRVGEKIFITPSGYSLRALKPDMIVTLDGQGKVLEGPAPTKDVSAHLGILAARPESNVICHVHGAFIIAVSTLLTPGPNALPPLTPGFAYFAHPLTMIPFMVPGTEAFAKAASREFSNPACRALLLQNHGLLSIGEDFEEAINIAEEIDEAARVFLLTNGKAKGIPEEMVHLIKKGPTSL
jgi:ribulose-5-phosphate 4-epimerase/fuculose-1-phosphate aldolase